MDGPGHERWRLRTLFAARVVSVFGNQLTMVAIPWFVLVTTGSPARTGLVGALETAIFALSAIPSGMLVDRIGPRAVMLAGDVWFTVLVASIPLLHFAGLLNFPLLVALTCLITLPQSAYTAGIMMSIKGLVGTDRTELAKASAERMLITQLSSMSGRAIAGSLLAFLGAMSVMLVDAGTYLASFALLALALPKRHLVPDASVAQSAPATAKPRWHSGFRFIWGHPVLAALLIGSVLSAIAFQAQYLSVPVSVSQGGYHPSWFGWVLAGLSVGTIGGSVFVRQVAAGWPMRRTAVVGLLAQLIADIGPAALGTHPAILLTSFTTMGLGGALTGALSLSVISAEAPEGRMGLVMTSWQFVTNLAAPVAMLAAGFAMETFSPQQVWVVCAVLGTAAFALQLGILRHRAPGPS